MLAIKERRKDERGAATFNLVLFSTNINVFKDGKMITATKKNKDKVFKCPCHYSTFDAEMTGQMVCGQATEDLPRVVLRYDDQDDNVQAVAIDGLIYGRQANVL